MPYCNDLVSIVMPAYRAEAYLQHSIRSVQCQTYSNWELIVTDDCSPHPDRSCDIIRLMAQQDPRIILNRLTSNSGPAAARNKSLSIANGRWIAFLDSDDQWLPEKLKYQIDFSKVLRAPLSYTGYRCIRGLSQREGKYIKPPSNLNYEQLLSNTAIATSTVLIDRSIVGHFAMPDAYYDDFACWLSLLKRGHVAYGLDEDLARYRIQKKSVSSDKLKSARMVWQAYREIEGLTMADSLKSFAGYAYHASRKYLSY